jgi:putative FmdB family regulatory protein
MPVYDFVCEDCGKHAEIFSSIKELKEKYECEECGGQMVRIFLSGHGAICYNNDADWLKSVTDIVDKDPSKPHCVEFRKNPTRENYYKWMKGEGIRPLEEGEERNNRKANREKIRKEREQKIIKEVLERRHKDRVINVR